MATPIANCPLVSVLVLSRGRMARLRALLASVAAQDYAPMEIRVLANGCAETASVVRAEFPAVLLTELPENVGCVAGRNRIAALARGELLLFLDDDGEVRAPDAVSLCVSAIRADPRVGVLSMSLLNAASDEPTGWRRTLGRLPYACYHASFAGGACLMRREAFAAAGGYDEGFRGFGEEFDLTVRLYEAGWAVLHFPGASFHHHVAKSDEEWREQVSEGYAHLQYTIARLYPSPWRTFASMKALATQVWIDVRHHGARHVVSEIAKSRRWARAGRGARRPVPNSRARTPLLREVLPRGVVVRPRDGAARPDAACDLPADPPQVARPRETAASGRLRRRRHSRRVNVLGISARTWRVTAFGAAVALRVAWLGRADLWTDEIQTLHAIGLPWTDMLGERLRAGHGPLYFAIEKAWCSAAGTSQFALRLPSAVFGLALLVPLWSLARRLLGERAAWWAVTFGALHPLLVELSREARMYSLLALAALVVADRAAAALDGEPPGPWFWLAASAGPLVHVTWGFAMLPLAAWLVLERRSAPEEARRASGRALVGIVASLAVLVVLLVFLDPQHQTLTRRPWHREAAVFVLRIFAGSDLAVFDSPLASAAIVVSWAVFGIAGISVSPPRARRLALGLSAGVPAMSVLVGVVGGVPWGPARYVQMAAIGVVLLAAAPNRDAARTSRAPILALVLLLLTSLALLDSPAQWSDAALRLERFRGTVVVDGESERIVLAHYLGRDVSVGTPASGVTAWRRARLVGAGASRRVEIVEESAPR